MNKAIVVFLLLVGCWPMAQADPARSAKDPQGQVSVQGCVSRSSGDYVLMQFGFGNSYVLHSANNIKLGHYLGEEVKVAGTVSPPVSDSSDAERSAPSTAVVVNSIKTISKECEP